VVVPEGLLFGSSSSHTELRRKLVEEFELQAVISLSPGVFKPYAGVKTAILMFRRPVAEKKADSRVWFYDIKNDGFDPDKITGGGRQLTPEKNDIPTMLRLWSEFRASGFSTPPGLEGGTLLTTGEPEPSCWWSTSETIAQYDYNLAAGRYKPRVHQAAPEDNPTDLIRQTLSLEKEIASRLEKLLKEVEAVE